MQRKKRNVIIAVCIAAVFVVSIYSTFFISYSDGYNKGIQTGRGQTLMSPGSVVEYRPNVDIHMYPLENMASVEPLNQTFNLTGELELFPPPNLTISLNVTLSEPGAASMSTGWVNMNGSNVNVYVDLGIETSPPLNGSAMVIIVTIQTGSTELPAGVNESITFLSLDMSHHPV